MSDLVLSSGMAWTLAELRFLGLIVGSLLLVLAVEIAVARAHSGHNGCALLQLRDQIAHQRGQARVPIPARCG